MSKWTIPLKYLMGDKFAKLRADLKAGGARFDSKRSEWVLVSEKQYNDAAGLLGIAVTQPVTQSVTEPAPQSVPDAVSQSVPDAVSQPAPEAAPRPISQPAVEASVVETGDVTSGGLLERDSEGKVMQKRVMELRPSRFVLINMPVEGLRRRRQLGKREDRTEEAGRYAGLDAVTVTTTTEMTYVLPDEKERVERLRGDLRNSLAKLGTRVVTGLVALPMDLEKEFDSELTRVKREAAECNRSTQVWKIFVNVVRLDAVVSDEEALARKVAYDMQMMFDEVGSALEACDVGRIEAACKELKYKAQSMAPGMLKGAVEAAIADARKQRSEIRKKLEAKKQTIEQIRDGLDTSIVDSARMMLDTCAIPEEIEFSDMVQSGRLNGIVDISVGPERAESIDDDDGAKNRSGNGDNGSSGGADGGGGGSGEGGGGADGGGSGGGGASEESGGDAIPEWAGSLPNPESVTFGALTGIL